MSAKPRKPSPRRTLLSNTTTNSLPQPQLVPKNRVGEVVQDFIEFGGAQEVSAVAQPDGRWRISAQR